MRAFTVRWRDAHARNTRTLGWQEAVEAITGCVKDIYEQNCKDGSTKIVNMPKGLKADAANLLVNIVHGRARIVPPGMEQHGNKPLTAEPATKSSALSTQQNSCSRLLAHALARCISRHLRWAWQCACTRTVRSQ